MGSIPPSFSSSSCDPLQLFVDFTKPPHNLTQARMEGSSGICYRPMAWNSRRPCHGLGGNLDWPATLSLWVQHFAIRSWLVGWTESWEAAFCNKDFCPSLDNAFSSGKHTCVLEHCDGGSWAFPPLLLRYDASPARQCRVLISMVQITSSSTFTRGLRLTHIKAAIQIACCPGMCIVRLLSSGRNLVWVQPKKSPCIWACGAKCYSLTMVGLEQRYH